MKIAVQIGTTHQKTHFYTQNNLVFELESTSVYNIVQIFYTLFYLFIYFLCNCLSIQSFSFFLRISATFGMNFEWISFIYHLFLCIRTKNHPKQIILYFFNIFFFSFYLKVELFVATRSFRVPFP